MVWSRGESMLAVGTHKGNLLIYNHRSGRYIFLILLNIVVVVLVVVVVIYASAATRGHGCVYVLQRFLFFFRSATIVHKYETTVLGNG